MQTIQCKYSSSGTVLYQCCDKTVENFIIPDNVTKIASGAFSNCDKLRQLVFHGNLKKIEDHAFQMCSSLEEIDLSSTKLKELGSNVFADCCGLKKVAFPDTLKTIPSQTFDNCTSLCEIRLPVKLKEIGNSAFRRCSNLHSINIPASVETIGDHAFEKCVSLERSDLSGSLLSQISSYTFSECLNLREVIFPDGLIKIREGAFKDCVNLFRAGMSQLYLLETIETMAFWGCRNLDLGLPENLTDLNGGLYGVKSIDIAKCPNFEFGTDDGILYNICKKTLVYAPETFSGEYSFDGLSREAREIYHIAPYAFYHCDGLTSVDIDFIENIYDYAFAGCVNLKYVKLEDISSFGKGVFSGCVNLYKVKIQILDDELSLFTRIPDDTFFKCCNLKEIQIPETVSVIGDRAFYGCSSLTDINIPYELTELGSEVFSGCSALKQILLYCKVSFIPLHAFEHCDSLQRVLLPECVGSIGNNAFDSCFSLSKINLPDGLYSIGSQAFFNCRELKLRIPASVEYIEPGALALIESFSVDPGNQHYVCDNAGALFKADVWSFEKNCRLYSLVAFPYSYRGEYTIPGNVNKILDMAFFGCSNLSGVLEINAPLHRIGRMAFSGCTSLTLLFSTFANAGEDQYEPGNECFWTAAFSGVKEIIISDKVDYFYYDKQGALHSRNHGRVKYLPRSYSEKYTISGKPERIYTGCFDGNIFLTEVVLPKSVQSIDPYAFANCYALKKVEFPQDAGPLIIDRMAFANCSVLTEVILPDNIICIAPDAFSGSACEEQIKEKYGHLFGTSPMFSSTDYRSWEDAERTKIDHLRKKIAFQ